MKSLVMKRNVVYKFHLFISAEISAHHFQLKCMGSHFFSGHPYIESTTVLSDNIIDSTSILGFILIFKHLKPGCLDATFH